MSDVALSYVRLERAPDAEDRNRWNVTYEAGDDCRIHRDELGWVWISQTFRETLREGNRTLVSAETKAFPPHMVTFVRPAAVVKPAERPETIAERATLPEIAPPVESPAARQIRETQAQVDMAAGALPQGHALTGSDPSYRHPKAKRR